MQRRQAAICAWRHLRRSRGLFLFEMRGGRGVEAVGEGIQWSPQCADG